MNRALFCHEMRRSVRLLALFGAIITLYVAVIIDMYNPETAKMLQNFAQVMPQLMAAAGMDGVADNLPQFMVNYLYGFILLLFPLIYGVVRAYGLGAGYVDRGHMITLLAAPVPRRVIAITQGAVLLLGVGVLLGYITLLEYAMCQAMYPGQVALGALLRLNGGLYCLQVCLCGVAFLASLGVGSPRLALGLGAGVPGVLFVAHMLHSAGADFAGYCTPFTLFNPTALMEGTGGMAGAVALLTGGLALFGAGVAVFCRRDLAI